MEIDNSLKPVIDRINSLKHLAFAAYNLLGNRATKCNCAVENRCPECKDFIAMQDLLEKLLAGNEDEDVERLKGE